MKNLETKTFDIVFNNETSSQHKGFSESIKDCQSYIQYTAGTNDDFFKKYKDGTVSIVCKETEEIIEVYSCEDGSLLESNI